MRLLSEWPLVFLLLFTNCAVTTVKGQIINDDGVNGIYEAFQRLFNYFNQLFNEPPGATKDANIFKKEYDFIVVGAGSGGSVVTNRLTEIPDWSVLLLEAGKEETLLTDVPLLVSYVVGTDYNWAYQTEKQDGICMGMKNGQCQWHRGKAMGGTSVINYMIYTRGYKRDYDRWAEMGNTGWSYEQVLPYFLKSEDMRVSELRGSDFHSSGGYLHVERPSWKSPVGRAFMAANAELGYRVGDPNSEHLGYSYVLSNTENGARCSASKAFLRPIRNRRNLHVAKQARVTKILMDLENRRAIGVEFLKNRKRHVVRATKEVILAAGAFNSPQLLMLSGIGPADHLKQLGIPVVRDLKVGHNLQDHVSMAGLVFLVNDSVTIVEHRYRQPRFILEYWLRGSGPFTLPGGAEALLFVQTKYAAAKENNTSGVEDHSPDMELVFGPGALTGDTGGSFRKLLGFDEDFYRQFYGNYQGSEAWSLVPTLLQPRSRGYMKLRSANPFHPPRFYPNYFENQSDLNTMVEGIKLAINISKTKAFQKYASNLMPIRISKCVEQAGPLYSDDYWACVCRFITTNFHHQVGTCKMGPSSDVTAVVDPELKVHGIEGLRVVDASIMPIIPSGHTNAVVFMIGEKASDMIKKTWSKKKK